MTTTFEWQAIFGRGLGVLESTHSELEFEHKFSIFLMEIKRVILVRICPTELPEIWIPIMCRERGIKKEV